VDGIQAIVNPAVNYTKDFSGTLIDGNDIYLTSALYSNCSGRRDPRGQCACAENAIDLKSGAENSARPFVITNNHIWGWKKTDKQCGGSGSWGSAIIGHYKLKNVVIKHNTIFDSQRGITLSTGPRNITITSNLMHGINSRVKKESAALVTTSDVSNVVMNGNTIVDAGSWITLRAGRSKLECNVIIGSGPAAGGRGNNTVGRNSYYRSIPGVVSGNGDVVFDLERDSSNVDSCFTVKRISGGKKVCLSYGKSSKSSPHNACAAKY
jgi:hypothetical protein